MESQSLISPTMDILILPLALILFIIWIVRRRKKRIEEIKANRLIKRPYTTNQIFGIVGILIFLLPIFWIVGVMLQKGLLFLFILLFGWIKLPIILTTLKAIFIVSTSFLLFACVYLVCELIWPKRYVAEANSVDNERAELKMEKT